MGGDVRNILSARDPMTTGTLVLTRKPGQTLVIPAIGVEIVFDHCSAGRVRLAIKGPPEHLVLRGELLDPVEG